MTDVSTAICLDTSLPTECPLGPWGAMWEGRGGSTRLGLPRPCLLWPRTTESGRRDNLGPPLELGGQE